MTETYVVQVAATLPPSVAVVAIGRRLVARSAFLSTGVLLCRHGGDAVHECLRHRSARDLVTEKQKPKLQGRNTIGGKASLRKTSVTYMHPWLTNCPIRLNRDNGQRPEGHDGTLSPTLKATRNLLRPKNGMIKEILVVALQRQSCTSLLHF